LLLFIFCCTLPFPVTAGPYTQTLPAHTKIKTVAIISAIGETFMFEHVRATPFEWAGSPDTSFFEISDWGVDDLVNREATSVLSKRFSVKPVKYEEADFDTWTWASLLRTIRALPLPEDDIDAYVLILRDWRPDEIGHSVHQVAGLGLYRRDGRAGTFAAYRIVVVDAHTYEVLASREALSSEGRLPWTPTGPSLWPKTQNDVTDAQKTTLQSGLNALIEMTLVSTLKRLIPAN
jgi:hypothetical protein